MRKTLMTIGWLAATAATTLVAYLAVDAAGSRVGDSPLATIVAPGSGPTTLPVDSTSTTSTTSTGSTAVTTTSPNPTTSTSTATTATTGTTSTTSGWEQQTINSTAGKVIIAYRPGEVRLESVAPLAGYSYDIEEAGPPEVRVEFDGPLRVEVRVRWRDGQLVTEIDESN